MLKALSALFALIERIAAYLTNKQLTDAGRAQQQAEEIKEIEVRVQEAEKAVSTPDPVRTERLRKRFDRSRSGE